MKAKCNFCEATATGTKDELIDKGWARAVIYAPVRKTITACEKHHKELKELLMETIQPKKHTIKTAREDAQG